MPVSDVGNHILKQVQMHEAELNGYEPVSIKWFKRSKTASNHRRNVEDVLNASMELRRLWLQIRENTTLDRQLVERYDRLLTLDDALRESVTGEIVSKVFCKSLIANFPENVLKSNGRSDYPDLYLNDLDYSGLPRFTRGESQTYGASLKGVAKRPVRIADGLEVKTCRNRIQVDCHHPHLGLHVILLYSHKNGEFKVEDICVGFLGRNQYRESRRNTTATTVKYSFNNEHFVSLLHNPND